MLKTRKKVKETIGPLVGESGKKVTDMKLEIRFSSEGSAVELQSGTVIQKGGSLLTN